jgi:uncharacterized protein YecE (DUF72 family)
VTAKRGARVAEGQLGLFAPPPAPAARAPVAPIAPVDDALRALAAKLPRAIRFGTSSWSFPGWRGLVWPDEAGWSETRCAREGLAVYATHPLFGTVGLDRGYYAPIPEADFASYARQLPEGFPTIAKVWEAITLEGWPRGHAAVGENPRFLSVDALEEAALGPHRRAFAANTGALVLEFPAGERLDPERFPQALGAFLRGAVARAAGLPLAVEVRDRKLLGPRLARAIGDAGAIPCFSFHPSMPRLSTQIAWASEHGLLEPTGAPIVARLMLPPGTTYAARKKQCAPFDRLHDAQDAMRDDVLTLFERAVLAGRMLFVTVNNKAEGSAPLTIRALAERIVARFV